MGKQQSKDSKLIHIGNLIKNNNLHVDIKPLTDRAFLLPYYAKKKVNILYYREYETKDSLGSFCVFKDENEYFYRCAYRNSSGYSSSEYIGKNDIYNLLQDMKIKSEGNVLKHNPIVLYIKDFFSAFDM
jgi:hypothetical protein